ncbi:Proline--tRNA ligase (Prolyl-tRNA synthetase) (ProRS) [Durusdinium trenchii]|uniref:Proline--tRNA ligase (Prolyl-tRNA synthetase) (ProRS) n=1 Tax=Durusdinium trenchii TaxID=1381693 RepID=A0ABP0NTK1_9DINO
MPSLTRDHAIDWVVRYGKAWKEQSVPGILGLFTEDGEYVERPYDPENGIYRGHPGIEKYWSTHIQGRERNVEFKHFPEDLVLDDAMATAVVKWEARFEVRQSDEKPWKTVQFLQIAKLRFAPDGRVRHFEEYWHARSFQHAAKGLRDPRARRSRCGEKRKDPMLRSSCCREALMEAQLGPFDREDPGSGGGALRLQARAAQPLIDRVGLAYGERTQVPVVYNALSKLKPSDADFVEWYRRVTSHLVVEESDMKGIPIVRPSGLFVWDQLRDALRRQLQTLQAQPFALPVTEHGANEPSAERYVMRGAAEPLLYKVIARSWVASQRDLPLILSRDVVAVTDETVKRPLPFVRSREMHVQEGHAVHSTEQESEIFLQKVMDVYQGLCRDLLCLRTSIRSDTGRKTLEVSIPRHGGMEVAAVKIVGSQMAEDFKMTFCTANASGGAVNRACCLSSFSATSRLVAAAICAHGDHLGCVWPPKVAPLQVVIIPLIRSQDRSKDDAGRRSVQQILEWCQEVTQQLASDTRAKSDLEDETPGKKIRHWIGRGVPLLLTVQLAEGEQLANVRMTARDMPGVEATPAFVATPSVAAHETRRQLEEMHRRLQQGMAGDAHFRSEGDG